MMEQYKNHPSIIDIKNESNLNANTYDFPHATAEEINTIVKDINPKMATGLDKIRLIIIALSASILVLFFTNIINKDIDNNRFFENA